MPLPAAGADERGREGRARFRREPDGAGLDRFAGEWLEPGHPLTDMDNVVLTPHVGASTYDTEINHTRMICEDIVRILGGERPLRCANPGFRE